MENTWTKPRRGGSKVGGGDDWGGGQCGGGKMDTTLLEKQ